MTTIVIFQINQRHIAAEFLRREQGEEPVATADIGDMARIDPRQIALHRLIFSIDDTRSPPCDLLAQAIHLRLQRPHIARVPRTDHRAGSRDIVEHFRALQDQIRQIGAVKNRQIQRLNRHSLGGLRDIDLQ